MSQPTRSRLLASLLLVTLVLPGAAQNTGSVPVYRWTTLAGRTSVGSEDGPATAARFAYPHGLAMDSAGTLYVADTGNHTIRKVTPAGLTSTFAGTAGQSGSSDGLGPGARFFSPRGLALDASGNLYVADSGNHTIRKITPAGVVTTLAGQAGKAGQADGAATAALFDSPDRLSVDTQGNVYLANGGVRKISGGTVQTVPIPAFATLPNGQTTAVSVFGCPAVDAAGQLHFWANSSGYYPESSHPWGVLVTLGPEGTLTSTERLYDPSLGTGGNFLFNDAAGTLFAVVDYMRLVSGQQYIAGYTLPAVGNSLGSSIRFVDAYRYPSAPRGCAVDQSGRWYYTRASDSAIVRNDAVLAGVAAGPKDGTNAEACFDRARYMDVDATGNVWVLEEGWDYLPYLSSPSSVGYTRLRKVTPSGTVSTAYLGPKMIYTPQHPVGVACDGAGNVYFATETQLSANGITINRITADTASVFLDAMASYTFYDFASDAAGNLWTYSGLTWEMLRRPTGGTWAALAGNPSPGIKDGKGAAASFGSPWSLATDKSGNAYFLDRNYDANYAVESCFVRKLTPDGTVTTITPNLVKKETVNGAVVSLYPGSLVINSRGEMIVTSQHGILQLDVTGAMTALGGAAATPGTVDALGDKARFTYPTSLAVDPQDHLYVLDAGGTAVRKGEFLGFTPGLTAQPQSLTVNVGGTVTFSVNASGTPAPTYQWYFNDNPFKDATARTLSFTNARSADAGDYSVVVTNSFGSVTSAKATLTVTAVSAPPPPLSPGGGGGGAPSFWFLLSLGGLRLLRHLRGNISTGESAGRNC